ncbi:hypothetical protein BRARA_E01331 [Brassica rapa]|uniref:Uncharacterized protein n=1 Tax=Brassica campestris TaxID=3711 RepID=A0A397Z9P4_BRACM|nr:hypothetical protein BRARA_E01331 [Brassica rapa]
MSQEDDIDVTPLSHCQTDWLGAWGGILSLILKKWRQNNL